MKKSLLALLLLSALPVHAKVADISRGEYLARAGDCTACHTSSNDKPFAGGKAIDTPIGVIYSTNITPDAKFGIGEYSFADFDTAMREGKAKDGHNLYPAMPYSSFAKLNDENMHALYDYFMHGVAAQNVENRNSEIPWPLSIRWPLAVWQTFFHEDKKFVPDAGHDAQWNRGAYLVQGLGHCGACHTPRGFALQEKGLTQDAADYLSGSEIGGWYAPNIRGSQRDEATLISLLKSGQSVHKSFAGPMAEVVTNSTQYLSDEDLQSIAVYLKSLPAPAAKVEKTAAVSIDPSAEKLYKTYCSTCHGVNGQGHDYVIPALAGNGLVTIDNPINLINVISMGAETPRTEGNLSYKMPGYKGVLNDQQMADVLTYIRGSWGNQAPAVSASDVSKVTKEKK